MKFKVRSNKVLTEAVSKSMPNWLKPSVFNSFVYGDTSTRNPIKSNSYSYADANNSESSNYELGYYKKSDKAKSYADKGYDLGSRLATGKRFHGNNMTWRNRSFTDVLNSSDINFAGADFKTGEIPKKSTDEKLTDPRYQCFFLIEKDGKQQIYAPGLNDKELTIIDPSKTFKYLSYAKIKPYIKDFCYVDLQEPNSTKSSIRNSRPERLPDSDRRYKTGTRNVPNHDYRNIDKSGFIRDPNKYKKILAKNKASNYGQLLQDMYDNLTKYKDLLNIYTKNSNLRDMGSVQSIAGNLYQAVSFYDVILNKVSEIENSTQLSKEGKLESILKLFDVSDTDYYSPSRAYRSALGYINNLKGSLDKYEPSYLEW